jgi:predicted RNase H-like HicB family nuclease
MSFEKLFVRCYAYQDDSLWLAFCIDLNLAAQADTLEEAKKNLSEQIADYFFSAFDENEEASKYLLTRKAPLSTRLHYYLINWLTKAHLVKNKWLHTYYLTC